MKLKEAIPDQLLRVKGGYNLDLLYSLKDDVGDLGNAMASVMLAMDNIGVWMKEIDVDHLEMKKARSEYEKLNKYINVFEKKVQLFIKTVRKL